MSDTLASTEARAVGIVLDHTSRRSHGMDHRAHVLFYPSVRFQTAGWVGAVCPNCHREIHHGTAGDEKNERLKQDLAVLEAT